MRFSLAPSITNAVNKEKYLKAATFKKMKSVQSTTDIVVLLALAYMLFFRQDVEAGPLKTALDISLIILFVVSIVEKAFSLYLKYREKKG